MGPGRPKLECLAGRAACMKMAVTTVAVACASAVADSFTDFDAPGFTPGASVHAYRTDGTITETPVSALNPSEPAWSVRRGGVDEQIVDLGPGDPTHGKVWRLSDRTATGGVESRPHSPRMAAQAGETGAIDDYGDDPVTSATFLARLDFRSATGGPQPGLSIQIAATCGGDCRQSMLRIIDDGTGFDLELVSAGDNSASGRCGVFERTYADLDLSYDGWHTLELVIRFEDGFGPGGIGVEGNDHVAVRVNGTLVLTASTWETCHVYGGSGLPRSIDRLSFGRGSVRAAAVGGGLYFDNVLVTTAPEVVIDSDEDGLADDVDECPFSDLAPTVVVGGRDSGVTNELLESGCTISDLIEACHDEARNHGAYVSCVAHTLRELKRDGVIRRRDRGRLQRLAARDRR